ncbi:MAG: hypothetical protein AAF986_04190 [Pseudomonadota bacterium]
MTDYYEPANTNRSFSDVMTNKKRNLAEDTLALGPTIYALEQAGVPHDVIADVLFGAVKAFMRPPKDAPASANVVWYAQLQRFRDELNGQIQQIEAVLDHHD